MSEADGARFPDASLPNIEALQGSMLRFCRQMVLGAALDAMINGFEHTATNPARPTCRCGGCRKLWDEDGRPILAVVKGKVESPA